ncbi:hypothetical protein F5Y16DRAFT_271820 [Xylariaceae sp. FL0255]|nr:hypothetical protein F5Y16DRAFT_271820 [Xylariaceae sp. FL0255]
MSQQRRDTTDPDDGASTPGASSISTQAEMAQAFKDLARGEQQATAIEAHLTSLESKLDALLASFEAENPESTGADTETRSMMDSEKKEKEEAPENK